MVERNDDRSFLDGMQESVRDWWTLMEDRGTRDERLTSRAQPPREVTGDEQRKQGEARVAERADVGDDAWLDAQREFACERPLDARR